MMKKSILKAEEENISNTEKAYRMETENKKLKEDLDKNKQSMQGLLKDI